MKLTIGWKKMFCQNKSEPEKKRPQAFEERMPSAMINEIYEKASEPTLLQGIFFHPTA